MLLVCWTGVFWDGMGIALCCPGSVVGSLAFCSSISKSCSCGTYMYNCTCTFHNYRTCWSKSRRPTNPQNPLHSLDNITKQQSHNAIPTPTQNTPDQHTNNTNKALYYIQPQLHTACTRYCHVEQMLLSSYLHRASSTYKYFIGQLMHKYITRRYS